MEEVLRAEHLSKQFPGVLAVDDVSFTLNKGEILALVGENGAGKSTLSLILSGIHKPDSGTIYLEGKPVSFNAPVDAIRAGIAIVFQELSLVGSLSVAENIFANRQPVGAVGTIRWDELYRQTQEFLSRFNLHLNPRQLVKHLSMGQQQILEILKAISINPKVLILDEPTSSLTESEAGYLFENIRKLQKQGMSFIYITHKLSEVFQIADRVMVMRDGKHVGTRAVSEVTENDLISMMVGRQITSLYGDAKKNQGDEYFRVQDFTQPGAFENISFGLKRGEILGFFGLIGAGRSELARAIVGLYPKQSGRVFLEGREIFIRNPRDAIQHGIAYLTEDRKGDGLFLNMTIRENLVAPSLPVFTRARGLLDFRSIEAFAQKAARDYDIVTPSLAKKVSNLSGGNQQKCLIAMWMGINPRVILFDEPTRGVDVGARAEIYHKLRELSQSGVGIVMISSDLPELIGMCDRILVMHQGRITGELSREEFSEEWIMTYAAGLQTQVSLEVNHG
ncbi:sugar ABC transporter ATP-binding protein [Thermanaerothrix sp. 4228-RoL]|uniref:Sugar ABC transporter ATP-binding protein n=1 Tax=Thermanaerothrix solaris TaxID=3058434 RepID=A0ABU3NJL0_9CHLR|nr:sugar ABC transporter ATP-binding protein [Thermanaerothrix sp. 4228-RoL]MDT8897044.1 sugar ABC transporter ATP-binding protein [Thermanaerothrix sp. 4228-RoL]